MCGAVAKRPPTCFGVFQKGTQKKIPMHARATRQQQFERCGGGARHTMQLWLGLRVGIYLGCVQPLTQNASLVCLPCWRLFFYAKVTCNTHFIFRYRWRQVRKKETVKSNQLALYRELSCYAFPFIHVTMLIRFSMLTYGNTIFYLFLTILIINYK